jgi:hypothetical protein
MLVFVSPMETNPARLPPDKRRKETADPDFVCKTMNKTRSSCEIWESAKSLLLLSISLGISDKYIRFVTDE